MSFCQVCRRHVLAILALWEAETGGFMCVLGQPGLYSEICLGINHIDH